MNLPARKGSRKDIRREPLTGQPMSVQGRRNVENAHWAIKAINRSLNAAVEEYKIPATVTHFLNGKYPYDLVVRPFLPGTRFGPAGINSMFWTNTKHRGDAIYWSREFEGFRLYPKYRPDKILGLARWMSIEDPYKDALAWLAVVSRAVSPNWGLFLQLDTDAGIDEHLRQAGRSTGGISGNLHAVSIRSKDEAIHHII